MVTHHRPPAQTPPGANLRFAWPASRPAARAACAARLGIGQGPMPPVNPSTGGLCGRFRPKCRRGADFERDEHRVLPRRGLPAPLDRFGRWRARCPSRPGLTFRHGRVEPGHDGEEAARSKKLPEPISRIPYEGARVRPRGDSASAPGPHAGAAPWTLDAPHPTNLASFNQPKDASWTRTLVATAPGRRFGIGSALYRPGDGPAQVGQRARALRAALGGG